jgi:hypothetical protein
LFGLAVPAVALFMIFSLLPYDRMVAHWPWGIGKEEVMAYQHLFDRRPGQHVQGDAELFKLTGGDQGSVTLSAGKEEAAATIMPLMMNAKGTPVVGGIALDFPEEHPFRGTTAMALVPADLRSLEALYAQAVTDSLDILAPGSALVQVERDGKKLGAFLAQERITSDYVLKHAPLAMVLVSENGTVPPDGRPTTVVGDTLGNAENQPLHADRFDTSATAALGLLALAEQRSSLLNGIGGALYDRVTGRVLPLYRMRFGADTAWTDGPIATTFRNAMATAKNRSSITRLADRLRADSAAWTARFLAIDSAAVPVLANGRNIGLVQAEVDHTREQFMQRLFHPATAGFIGASTAEPVAAAIPLDPWLKPFRSDPDTIRFVRGKYEIDHDLVLPKGMAVVLERGTRWFIAPGVSVVVNGELHMRGTDLNPVFIRPMDDAQPFGSIAVNGTGATRVRIRGLRMSGGSDLLLDGIRHGGMLSFISADVHVDNCSIGPTFGDASISQRRGTLAMSDCYLAGAGHGYVDLSEVNGSIERCAFIQPAGGGDAKTRTGLGLRASHMLVRSCTFADLPFVALRAGRASEVLVTGSQFTNNAMAMRGSDGSNLDVDACTFTGNEKVFVLHRDKVVLGGATLMLYANTLTGNTTEQEVDATSTVKTGTAVDPKLRQTFGAQN